MLFLVFPPQGNGDRGKTRRRRKKEKKTKKKNKDVHIYVEYHLVQVDMCISYPKCFLYFFFFFFFPFHPCVSLLSVPYLPYLTRSLGTVLYRYSSSYSSSYTLLLCAIVGGESRPALGIWLVFFARCACPCGRSDVFNE